MSKAHHVILWETTKAVCHSEAIVWENLLRSMHISLSWDSIWQWGYLLGHKDASKGQCLDCGKLLSLGSNKPGKQTVTGWKSSRKMPQRYLYTGNLYKYLGRSLDYITAKYSLYTGLRSWCMNQIKGKLWQCQTPMFYTTPLINYAVDYLLHWSQTKSLYWKQILLIYCTEWQWEIDILVW